MRLALSIDYYFYLFHFFWFCVGVRYWLFGYCWGFLKNMEIPLGLLIKYHLVEQRVVIEV